MELLGILVLTLVVLTFIFFALIKLKYPVYRINRDNVKRLLQLVLDHQASENDWQVFVSMPIRYDDELEQVRQRCVEIEDREYLGLRNKLFSRQGEEQIEELLLELEQREVREF